MHVDELTYEKQIFAAFFIISLMLQKSKRISSNLSFSAQKIKRAVQSLHRHLYKTFYYACYIHVIKEKC